MINKNWFISQYEEIHNNLYILEKKIKNLQKDKSSISLDPSILLNLRTSVENEIDRLNKTRDYERKIYGYDEK